jgi:hypothetical protein
MIRKHIQNLFLFCIIIANSCPICVNVFPESDVTVASFVKGGFQVQHSNVVTVERAKVM